MKPTGLCVVVLMATVFAQNCYAQTDSLSFPQKLLQENQTSKVRKQLSKARQPFALKKPSVNLQIPKDTTRKPDSLRNVARSKVDSLKSVGTSITSKPAEFQNSVRDKVNKPIQSVNSDIQAVGQSLTKPIDSLNGKIATKLDAIGNRMEKPLEQAENKINTVLQKTTENSGANIGNVDLTNPDIGDKVGLDLDGKIPGDVKLDEIKSNDILKNDLPGLDGLKQKEQISEITNRGTELQNLPKEKLKSIDGAEKVKKITGKADQLDGKLEKVQGYEDDAKKLAAGKVDKVKELPQSVEGRLSELEETKELGAKSKQMKEYEDRLKKYQDKKAIQQELKAKASTIANDELMQNAGLLQKAQDHYAKGKKINDNFQTVQDLKRLPPNSMKGKPLRTRLVPGLTMQIFQSDKLLIDVSPQIGFRVSGRFTTGIASVLRINIDKSNKYFVESERIYGGRFITDFEVAKGFYAHGDFEYLRTNIADMSNPERWQNHVAASHFGVGKFYSITKSIKGNAMGLYRLEYAGHIPGPKFVLRVGFNLHLDKKKKKIY